MIERLYSEYDSDLTIRPLEGKTFNENRINFEEIIDLPGVVAYSRAIEEVVILKHEKKWINAQLVAVDSTFLQMANMARHMVDGEPVLVKETESFGIIGATLLDNLKGYIPKSGAHETVICYVPKREIKLRPGNNPFDAQLLKLSGRMNFNREINAQHLVVPLELAKSLLRYTDQISAVYVDCAPNVDRNAVKQEVQAIVGTDFKVKTSYEKNELIYKTSKSEKMIVLIILLFIFVLAAFNLVASLTMLFVEKLENVKTLISMGANRKIIFNIFFLEGLLISGKGILIGACVGYAVSFAQIQFGWISMPNSGGEAFPIRISLADGFLILTLVAALSILFTYLPVKYLIRKNTEVRS